MALYNVTILTTCLPFLPLFTPPPICRLGLDIGGGTGSFAAHMALYNVTILTTAMNVETVVGRKQGLPYMEAIALRGLIPLHLPHKSLATILTTAMNVETVVGRKQGLPYMEAIALRGLIPLHLPHKARLPFFDGALDIIHSVNSVKWPSFLPPFSPLSARLPFFDGALDIIHSVNSVKYLPMLEFEEMLFEWDRVLRVGGVIWVEMFYAPLDEFPVYVAILNLLGYNRLHWRVLPSTSLPCPPPPSGGVIWLEMFYAPLDEFPVYVAILNLLSYNRLHWRVLPKPDPGERKGPHVYLNCLLEKPVRREEGWVEAGRREEGRGEEEGGRVVGGREGGTSEDTGGKEGMEREVGGREEGGRREEGRGEGSSNHRSEGDVEQGRRIEGAGIGNGSRQGGAEEDGKGDEGNGKMERNEEERKLEAGRRGVRKLMRMEGEEGMVAVVRKMTLAGGRSSLESIETSLFMENPGPSWCEEAYADGGRGRHGGGGSEDDSGWGKELFRVHRTS
ncbi:unnamed protein product [Closterium sp. Naga37s-1]|nr:unnamed protein product [Closterium sp. Naga37s-1]